MKPIPCIVCGDDAVTRMQTTEYEDWFCKNHYLEALNVIMTNQALRMIQESKKHG